MRPTTISSVLRLAARAAALVGCVFAVAVCGEQGRFTTSTGGSGGTGGGGGSSGGGAGPGVIIQAPSKTAIVPVAVGDSVFVQVSLNDTRGVTSLLLTGNSVRGSVSLGTDTTVVRFTSRTVTLPKTQDTVITRYLRSVTTDSTSEFVTVTALAVNAANDTTRDTSVIRVVKSEDFKCPWFICDWISRFGISSTARTLSSETWIRPALAWLFCITSNRLP